MTLVGVTGAFSTGKTTVTKIFKSLGARTIDADKIVHELYEKDEGIKSAVLKNFGERVFTENKLDRKKLKRAAFASKKNLKVLCGIVHPRVIKKIKEKAGSSPKGAIIAIDAPLLIESGFQRFVDFVVVVTAGPEKQITRSRLKGFTKKDLLLRKASQMSLKEKEKYADFVIDNNQSKTYTEKQVKNVWKKIKGR